MTANLRNDRFIRALMRKKVDRTPVWIMRQAGRYLPEYREIRAKAGDFLTLCSTPKLACEVTLQPIRRFGFDAAILFSDILVIPDAMGLELYFETGGGPRFRKPVQTPEDIARLKMPEPEKELDYVLEAIDLIVNGLDGEVPLIGFAGSPWTVATYAVESGSSKDFARIKGMMYNTPDDLHRLLEHIADATAAYLNAQINAGVDAVMLFDTWGGVLTRDKYEEFSLRYMARILKKLAHEVAGRSIPAILFTKGGSSWLESIAETGCEALGIDWMTDLSDARARVGSGCALQGNLDPAVLYAEPEVIRQEVGKVLAAFGEGSGHVFNLGHGISPGVPPEHVGVLVEAVRDLSPEFHS